jgi:hypothetical protein
MPTFAVTIQREVFCVVEVTADSATEAEATVHAVIQATDGNPDLISQYYDTAVVDEDTTVMRIEPLLWHGRS